MTSQFFEALAHGGSHGEDAEASAAGEHHTPEPEAVASEEMPESPGAEGVVMPATDMPMVADETSIKIPAFAERGRRSQAAGIHCEDMTLAGTFF